MEEQRTENRGAQDRNCGIKKGTLVQLLDRVQRTRDKKQSRERGDRGRDTRNRGLRLGTASSRQGTDT